MKLDADRFAGKQTRIILSTLVRARPRPIGIL